MSTKRQAPIRSRVSLHDRSQVEITFSYLLGSQDTQGKLLKKVRDSSYDVDAYFFFPAQMRINSETYPKERFYQDLRTFIRLREPRLSYKRLIGTGLQPSVSPVVFVRRYLEHLAANEKTENIELMVDEIRLFACSFASFVFRRSERRKKKIANAMKAFSVSPSKVEFEKLRLAVEGVEKFIDRGFKLLLAWRELMQQASTIDAPPMALIRQELNYVNEYCSYSYRDALVSLLGTLQLFQSKGGESFTKGVQDRLFAAIRLERWHSRKMGYYWIEAESSVEYQERYVNHRSALKRRVWSVLYLDARTKPLFAIQRQTGAIISAGLAGAWAVTAEIILRQRGLMPGGNGFSSLGVSGFLIVTALIMAYILKDRIKELGRSYLQLRGVFKIPDNSNEINFRTADGEKRNIGVVKEDSSFQPKRRLPEDIIALRERKSEEHIDPEELYRSVLHYRKKIHLNSRSLIELPQPIMALHDILRLSVSSYTARLDESLHRTQVLNERGAVEEILMPKVYHLDIILKYSNSDSSEKSATNVYDYIRLYINKEGLIRIKQLSTPNVS